MTRQPVNYYQYRFVFDFIGIGVLCFCTILTVVAIYLIVDLVDETNEVRDVFMHKKSQFENYANDALHIIKYGRHYDGFDSMFGTLVRTNRKTHCCT
ncbi:unnamed protein product [Caenorhabditis bovis]|uniref:Uncharacterized protein n=1 Tax=Caenorhabditis bovis TaxID=2654633 RepID=A0A8S1F1K8_9PELO|nr:unnamed protein product [Caenorhabditis bovis]